MLEKIFNLMVVPEDKANHLIYGLFIFIISNLIFSDFLISISICTVIAILKEVYDHYHEDHTASFLDVIYTIAGGLLGLLIIITI